jgi:hypothetical protein
MARIRNTAQMFEASMKFNLVNKQLLGLYRLVAQVSLMDLHLYVRYPDRQVCLTFNFGTVTDRIRYL